MFGLLFDTVQFAISIVYPLHQSYKTILTRDFNETMQWLIYWIVLALLINLQNIFSPILRFIPFIKFFKVYLMVWLTFPILDKKEYRTTTMTSSKEKVNGAIVLWDFYIAPFLANFDSKLSNFVNLNLNSLSKVVVNLYNLVIDTWFQGNERLKFFGGTNSNKASNFTNKATDEAAGNEESFLGSVYVIFKDTKFLSPPAAEKQATSGSTSTTGIVANGIEKLSQSSNTTTIPENRNMTLLKSLISIIPYNSHHQQAHNPQFSESSSSTNTTAGPEIIGGSARSSTGTEDFDVVDASEIHESASNNGGSGTATTSWFRWRSNPNLTTTGTGAGTTTTTTNQDTSAGEN